MHLQRRVWYRIIIFALILISNLKRLNTAYTLYVMSTFFCPKKLHASREDDRCAGKGSLKPFKTRLPTHDDYFHQQLYFVFAARKGAHTWRQGRYKKDNTLARYAVITVVSQAQLPITHHPFQLSNSLFSSIFTLAGVFQYVREPLPTPPRDRR